MARVYQEYMGRFALTNADAQLVVGANTVTLTNGYYYIDGYTGEANAQFCNHLQTKIRLGADGQTSTNVSYNGQLVIALTTNANITFVTGALANICGFNSTTTSNLALHVGQRAPRYVWRPTVPAQEYTGTLDDPWLPVTPTKYRRAADGSVRSAPGTTAYECEFTYQALPLLDVIKAVPATFRSLQEFFEDVICAGKRLRIYPDRTKRTSADCHEAVWGGEEPGRFAGTIGRLFRAYQGYWKVKLPFWKWTS